MVFPEYARLMVVAVLACRDEGVFVSGDRTSLRGGDEARPDPDPVGAERECGGEPAAVEDASCRDDRHLGSDGVDDLGHERHGRDEPGVAAGLGSLCDDQVAPGVDRARRACSTFPHMFTTRRPLSWHSSTTSAGTPRPATKTEAPPSMMSCTCAAMSPGIAVRRSTPKGRSVSSRTAAISLTIFVGDIVDAPRHPNPPASETAATSSWYETPPMPASITGCSIPSDSVSLVRNVTSRIPCSVLEAVLSA